jgi:predicted component of type VI protein secretion system
MKVVLNVVGGPETGRVFEFRQADSFLVGRSPKAHFVLDAHADRQISRHHFLLDVRPPRVIIQDLDSTNGTHVNSARINRCELGDRDEIRIGKTHIRVSIVASAAGETATVICAECGATSLPRRWEPTLPLRSPARPARKRRRSSSPRPPASTACWRRCTWNAWSASGI